MAFKATFNNISVIS